MIVTWAPIEETEALPPFGNELREHLLSYKGSRRTSSFSAWNLLYHLLLENKLPIGMVAFMESGKPFFADQPLCFSLSHSKDLCAAAISDRPVGVDIEYCRPFYKPHLIERSLTPAEKEAFDGDFTRIWCRKEAVAKMTGKGITGFPTDIDTTKYSFEEHLTITMEDKYWIVVSHGDRESRLRLPQPYCVSISDRTTVVSS